MSRLRVALCADFPEERWPSMDRVAAELAAHVRRSHAASVDLTGVCPPFTRRAMRLSSAGAAFTADRALNRWWDYPRRLGALASGFDVFHVIDHSYAHLLHRLPRGRTVVTCHDLDTFRSVLRPEEEPRSAVFRLGTRRILQGLGRAGWITCDTAAVRAELLASGIVNPERVSVVPVGVSDAFLAGAGAAAVEAAAAAAPPSGTELLHVGSTIPRKRIDTLLEVTAALAAVVPDIRLVRVGDPFTPAQEGRLRELRLEGRVSFVRQADEATLAALYGRAAVVLLPSAREGFGLPLLEALACGTPVVASDLAVLREVGGAAADYCPVGDVRAWTAAVVNLLDLRRRDDVRWHQRREAGRARARAFTWAQFASRSVDIYQALAEGQAARLAS